MVNRWGEHFARAVTGPFAALIPQGLRPIKTSTGARGMLRAMKHKPAGMQTIESGELQSLGA